MSVEAMTMVTIWGPENMVGTAIQNLVLNREFHLENAIKTMSTELVVSEQQSHIDSLDVELSRLFEMKYLKFRFGRIPADMYKDCSDKVCSRPDVYFFPSGRTEHWIYGAYFVLPGESAKVDGLFATMGFERIHIDVDEHADGAAQDAIEKLKGEVAKAGTKVKKLLPFDTSNPYSELLSKACELAKELGIAPDYRDFSGSDMSIENAEAYLKQLSEQTLEIKAEWEEKSKIIHTDLVFSEQLSHFESFDVELSRLFEMRYLKFRFGRIPSDMYKQCTDAAMSRPDVFYIPSGRTEHWVYGAYFALPEDYSRVDVLFATMGFERIHIDDSERSASTAHDALEQLKLEVAEVGTRLKKLDEDKKRLAVSEKDTLLTIYSWLRFMNEASELCSYAGYRHGKFYLVGWVPKSSAKSFSDECESYEGFGCSLTEPKESGKTQPPVKLKPGFLSRIYEPFVEMYGLPAYGELDPRLFMALTYTLLFGIMFGDVGQGVLLIISGLLLWKLKGMWLGRIVALCGVSATALGFVYGSVFGNEHILPGFKVLEDGNTMRILMVAVALGVLLILICMIMNMITGIRQKDIKKIFFEPNGLAGFVMYTGVAYGAVSQLVFGKSVFSPLYICLVIVLPLLLILGANPLSKLLAGQKDWKPESFGMFLVEGFFELFETLLSYVSNTVSFLRVGAFAISHAGMMMVVYLLSAGADGGYSIGGLIFGNLLVTVLETVLVCIQVMRLEFYEMFGRFYKSGGVKFSPRSVEYKAAR